MHSSKIHNDPLHTFPEVHCVCTLCCYVGGYCVFAGMMYVFTVHAVMGWIAALAVEAWLIASGRQGRGRVTRARGSIQATTIPTTSTQHTTRERFARWQRTFSCCLCHPIHTWSFDEKKMAIFHTLCWGSAILCTAAVLAEDGVGYR